MVDIARAGGYDANPPVRTGYSTPIDNAAEMRMTALEASSLQGVEIPGDQILPLYAFYNKATSDIHQLRHPFDFPALEVHTSQAPSSAGVPGMQQDTGIDRSAEQPASVQQLSAGQPGSDNAEKLQLINSMISRSPHAGDLRADQVEQLRNHLLLLDPGVLGTMDAQGTKITIAIPGKPLSKTGAITDINVKEQFSAMASRREEAQSIMDTGVKERDKHIARLREGRLDDRHLCSDTASEDYIKFLSSTSEEEKLQMLNNKALDDINENLRENSNTKCRVFAGDSADMENVPGLSRSDMETMASLFGRQKARFSNIEDMAKNHGARTPEEITEFTALVKDLNGNRLAGAQKSYIESLRKEDPEKAHKLEEELQENPDKVAMDTLRTPILVPDLFYRRAKNAHQDGPAQRVDYHDLTSIRNWESSDGVVHRDPEKRQVNGQYFDNTKTVLIGEDMLKESYCTVHESGHAYEHALKQQDPAYYEKYRADRDLRFRALKKKEDDPFITGYARTNELEFFAESFTAYYLNKKMLRTKDEEWYKTVEQAITHRAG